MRINSKKSWVLASTFLAMVGLSRVEAETVQVQLDGLAEKTETAASEWVEVPAFEETYAEQPALSRVEVEAVSAEVEATSDLVMQQVQDFERAQAAYSASQSALAEAETQVRVLVDGTSVTRPELSSSSQASEPVLAESSSASSSAVVTELSGTVTSVPTRGTISGLAPSTSARPSSETVLPSSTSSPSTNSSVASVPSKLPTSSSEVQPSSVTPPSSTASVDAKEIRQRALRLAAKLAQLAEEEGGATTAPAETLTTRVNTDAALALAKEEQLAQGALLKKETQQGLDVNLDQLTEGGAQVRFTDTAEGPLVTVELKEDDLAQAEATYQKAQAAAQRAALALTTAEKNLAESQQLLKYQTELQAALTRLLERQDALKTGEGVTQAELTAISEEIQVTAQQIFEREQAVTEATQQLSVAQTAVSQAETAHQAAQRHLATLTQEQLLEATQVVEKAEAGLKAAETHLQASEADLATSQKTYDQQWQLVQAAQQAVNQAQKDQQAAKAALATAQAKGKLDLSALLQAVQQAEQALVTATDQLTAANKALTAAQASEEKRVAALTQAQQAVQSAQGRLETANQTLSQRVATAKTTAQALTQAKTAYDQLTAPTSAQTINQIYLSPAYIGGLKAYSQLMQNYERGNATHEAQKLAIEDGLYRINREHLNKNQYLADASVDDTTLLDVNQLSTTHQYYLAQYAANLLNQIHQLFGTGQVYVNVDAQRFAQEVAKNYVSDQWLFEDVQRSQHDDNAVNRAALNYGLRVPTGAAFDTEQYYENMRTEDKARPQATLATLRQKVFEAIVVGFLFDGTEWDHANVVAGLANRGADSYIGMSFSSRLNAFGSHLLYISENYRDGRVAASYIRDTSKFDRSLILEPLDTGAGSKPSTEALALAKQDYEAAKQADDAAQTALSQAQLAVQQAQMALSEATAQVTQLSQPSAVLSQASRQQAQAQLEQEKAQAHYRQAQAALLQAETSVDDVALATELQELTQAVYRADQALQAAQVLLEQEHLSLQAADRALVLAQTHVAQTRDQVATAQATLLAAQSQTAEHQQADLQAAADRLAVTQSDLALAQYHQAVALTGLAASHYLLTYQTKYQADLDAKLAILAEPEQGATAGADQVRVQVAAYSEQPASPASTNQPPRTSAPQAVQVSPLSAHPAKPASVSPSEQAGPIVTSPAVSPISTTSALSSSAQVAGSSPRIATQTNATSRQQLPRTADLGGATWLGWGALMTWLSAWYVKKSQRK